MDNHKSDQLRVLYVDDNRFDRELVRDALEHAERPCSLTETTSLKEFKQVLEEAPWDLVLTDLVIGGDSGLDVLRHVVRRRPEIPVIVVTGTGTEELAVEAMKSGAADYIIKHAHSIRRLPIAIETSMEHRRDQEARRSAERALGESEARFRRAVHEAPVPMMMHAEDGELLAVSQAWFSLTGYDKGEISSIQSWIEHAHGERVEEIHRAITATYHAGHTVHEGEFAVRCADGSERVWDFSSTSLGKLPDGRRCALSIANDVTERIALESQLRQAQKLEAVGQLAGGVAHDFNNMLQVIIGYGRLAQDELSEEETPNWLRMILEAASRAATLTRQLLAFSRIQAISPEEIELPSTLADLTKMLRRLVGENIQIALEMDGNTWPVELDPSQLDSVVVNLVINSRDAIDSLGTITIETGNAEVDSARAGLVGVDPGEYVRLTVRDTGSGMDSETREHMFDPFFTTKTLGTGSGLGLASVYGIVRQNGGFINVTSAPSEGTEISVHLPRYIASSKPRSERAAGHPTERERIRVLLVEDEEAVLEITRQLLERLGYQVVATRDPLHALRLVEEGLRDITVVVSDVVMPEMNGRVLVQRIRSHIPDLPVVFTSGYPSDVIGRHGVLEPDVHFLPKPFDRAKLREKIAEALQDDRE